jgi:hypothetical protein
MGFLKKNKSNKYGTIVYNEGSPRNVKFDAKDGQFKELSANFGSDTLKIQIVKEVILPEMVLFPHNKDEAKPYQYVNLFFIDSETNEVCSGLIKTYSESDYSNLKAEILAYNKINDTDYDISDFHIHCEFLPQHLGSPYFGIHFTFCVDKDGEPCDYFEIDKKGKRKVNDKAILNKLDEETYERNALFFTATDDGCEIYDYNLGKEMLKSNFDEKMVKSYQKQHRQVVLMLLSKFGYFDDVFAQTKISQSQNLSNLLLTENN